MQISQPTPSAATKRHPGTVPVETHVETPLTKAVLKSGMQAKQDPVDAQRQLVEGREGLGSQELVA